MEIISRENHSCTDSPRSNASTAAANNGVHPQIPTPPLTPTTPTFPRSDSNPYPTTFVQADTSSFKQVVQMLTGSSQEHPPPPAPPPSAAVKNFSIPPVKTAPKKQGFKLYERRNSLKNSLMINTLVPNYAAHNNSSSGFSSPLSNKPEILSPSVLDFPSLTLSPVTPLNDDPFDKSSPSVGNSSSSEEEKAIAEKGFYLHPSPMSTPRDSEPQLLTLFPLTSPRVSESSPS